MIVCDRQVVDYIKGKGQSLPSDARVIGIGYNGGIVGALVYSRWRCEGSRIIDVELTVWCDRPESFTRSVHRAMMDYPFRQLGADRMTVLVEQGSTAEKMALRHGFTHEGTMRRLHGPDQQVYGRLNDGR